MSFAMDDLSRSYGVDPTLQTRLIEEARTVEKPTDTKTSDSTRKEPEVKDVFETSPQKQDSAPNSSENIQNQATAIDITKESLDKIASCVSDIKTAIASGTSGDASGQKIDENYDKINQIAKETSFNGTNLIKTSDDTTKNNSDNSAGTVSLKEMDIHAIKNLEINTPEQKDKSVEKLNDIIKNIKNKEQDLNDKKEELTQRVNRNSLVELKLSPEEEKEEEVSAQKLKETTTKNIKDAPEKSLKMHIKHLDKNLLLAMLSLRCA
jgi:hypothetical protein